jgi:hypothetical protein
MASRLQLGVRRAVRRLLNMKRDEIRDCARCDGVYYVGPDGLRGSASAGALAPACTCAPEDWLSAERAGEDKGGQSWQAPRSSPSIRFGQG